MVTVFRVPDVSPATRVPSNWEWINVQLGISCRLFGTEVASVWERIAVQLGAAKR